MFDIEAASERLAGANGCCGQLSVLAIFERRPR